MHFNYIFEVCYNTGDPILSMCFENTKYLHFKSNGKCYHKQREPNAFKMAGNINRAGHSNVAPIFKHQQWRWKIHYTASATDLAEVVGTTHRLCQTKQQRRCTESTASAKYIAEAVRITAAASFGLVATLAQQRIFPPPLLWPLGPPLQCVCVLVPLSPSTMLEIILTCMFYVWLALDRRSRLSHGLDSLETGMPTNPTQHTHLRNTQLLNMSSFSGPTLCTVQQRRSNSRPIELSFQILWYPLVTQNTGCLTPFHPSHFDSMANIFIDIPSFCSIDPKYRKVSFLITT